MTESKYVRLTFLQLLLFLLFQSALLGGAFYLGMRFPLLSNSTTTVSSAPVQPKPALKDAELAQLLPNAKTANNTEDADTNPSSPPFTFQPTPAKKNLNSNTGVLKIKSSSNSGFTLQIASYPEEEVASKVVEAWKKKGYLAFLSVEDLEDKGKWYRVNVGNFGDETSAQDMAREIQKKENVIPQVVASE